MHNTTSANNDSGGGPSLPLRDPQVAASTASLVTEMAMIHVSVRQLVSGNWLSVPLGYSAVIPTRGGRTLVVRAGYQRVHLPAAGFYHLYLVDIRDQVTLVQVTERAADMWLAGLEAEVVWRVVDPARVCFANADKLAARIYTATRSALRDVILSTPHDRLMGVETRPLDSRCIGGAIMQRLNANQAIQAIKVERVTLGRRTPDEQRLANLRQAKAEAVRYQAALAIETQQAEFAKARSKQRAGVLDTEQLLSLKETQYAIERQMAQQLGNVGAAKVTAETNAYIQQRERQIIETDNLRHAQQLEYELAKETLKTKAEVLSSLASSLVTLASSQGALMSLDQKAIDALGTVVQSVIKDVSYAPSDARILGYSGKEDAGSDGEKRSNGQVPLEWILHQPR